MYLVVCILAKNQQNHPLFHKFLNSSTIFFQAQIFFTVQIVNTHSGGVCQWCMWWDIYSVAILIIMDNRWLRKARLLMSFLSPIQSSHKNVFYYYYSFLVLQQHVFQSNKMADNQLFLGPIWNRTGWGENKKKSSMIVYFKVKWGRSIAWPVSTISTMVCIRGFGG